MLSVAGKEVLLKSVVMALPIYYMSCFRLPRGLCKKISKTADRFWSKGERNTAMHWIAWEKMTEPNECRGMRFRDSESFNQALLGKKI